MNEEGTSIMKKGYINTEIGVIPKDWKLTLIKNISTVITGGTPSTKIFEYWNGEIKWMSSGELNKKFIYDTEKRITKKGLDNSSAKIIPSKSVLIGLAGQGKTRGTVAINFVKLSINQSIAAVLPSNNHIPEFLYHNLSNRYYELRKLSTGEGGRGGLNKKIIENLFIPLPPLSEQKAIAKVLGDIDSLIESLDRLIEKKRLIKKGAMQELLTGKKRLAGFEGEWVKKRLGDIFYISSGSSKSKFVSKFGKYILIDMGSISRDGKIIKSKKISEKLDTLFTNDLVMPKDDIGEGLILGKVIIIPENNKYILGDHVYKLTIKNNKIYYPLFFYFLINSYNVNKSLKKKATGSAQKGLSKKNIYEHKILVPSSLQEQQAIAKILSDMDAEIEALEAKKQKYENIKKGAMELLLTGKVRLKDMQ